MVGRLRPTQLAELPWSTTLIEPEGGEARRGAVRIAGWLAEPSQRDLSLRLAPAQSPGPSQEDLFVLVHGLGGDADRPYMRQAAANLQAHGYSTLRLSMRGAGNSSPDFYHAGLDSDIAAVLADPALARHPRVWVVGFSLGGHIAARLALRPNLDPRVRAVVSICSPLDLHRNVELLDLPGGWLYRRFVLSNLARSYERVSGQAMQFRSIRDWDATTIVPRFGFESCEAYWRSQSAGPRLREARIPILFIATQGDPMVPAETLEPHLRRAGPNVDVRWLRRGGHIGFPADTDLGLPGERGLFNQILTWCERV